MRNSTPRAGKAKTSKSKRGAGKPRPTLTRAPLRTSRLLDFASEKELTAQCGHERYYWPLVILKELLDNSLDACEEANISPEISVVVDAKGIKVLDNGPGLPAKTIKDVLDFSIRVSSREAYVAPDRGAQGNALKTIIAMPFVIHGERGTVAIQTGGKLHHIEMRVDRIRQEPILERKVSDDGLVKKGTAVWIEWPDSARSELEYPKDQFLQIAADYTILNPHLTLAVEWFGELLVNAKATDPKWAKWRPDHPTSAHWYEVAHLERLLAGYVAQDRDRGKDRTVREVVTEFDGLSGTAKQKAVLETSGYARTNLSALINGDGMDLDAVERLLLAMREHSTPVKPKRLGLIGQEHIEWRFARLGCDMKTFQYKRVLETTSNGLPEVLETAFAVTAKGMSDDLRAGRRQLISGVNWSPGIIDPFRSLGSDTGESLSSVLADRKAGSYEPVVLLLHLASPRVRYLDRGKSSIALEE